MRNSNLFDGVLESAWEDLGIQLSLKQRGTISSHLLDLFVNKTPKKPVPDLAVRLAKWQTRIELLAKTLTFEYKDGKLNLQTIPQTSDTLLWLERGTDWFSGNPDIKSEISFAAFAKSAL